MLYLGCPIWANTKWKSSLFAANTSSAEFLSAYSRFFNTVEGNTTFYADPTPQVAERWFQDTDDNFRFILKVPQRISHQPDADTAQLEKWLQLVGALKHKLALVHLQLSAGCGPSQFPYIAQLTAQISVHYRCAVEVRHPAFFDKAEHEVRLHRMLQHYEAERVVIDSRALFAQTADIQDPGYLALLAAQAKKPRVPLHVISFSNTPVLRFIGTDNMQHNRLFYQPWLGKIQQWLDEGKTPYCFFHTPDNALAPQLCRQFAEDLNYNHRCRQNWPGEQQFALL